MYHMLEGCARPVNTRQENSPVDAGVLLFFSARHDEFFFAESGNNIRQQLEIGDSILWIASGWLKRSFSVTSSLGSFSFPTSYGGATSAPHQSPISILANIISSRVCNSHSAMQQPSTRAKTSSPFALSSTFTFAPTKISHVNEFAMRWGFGS